MVHVERYQPDNLRNGRSRGPSPNGHNSPETSDDDSTKNAKGNKTNKAKSEYEEKIRVGKDYQTVCPDFIPPNERKLETLSDRALLVWSPTKDIPDDKLENYITVAKEKYGYNGEQALGMLFWHKHDLERAVMDLANFTPFPDEWTDEDKVLFEQAFQFHGKSFHRIRQMLPDKNIASLVKYYYSWKKNRSRTSVMDRQEKMKAKEGSENGSENGSNEDSDNEDKKWPLHRGIRRASRSPPPRTSDESSNSVSSSAMKQASPNQNSGNSTTNNATNQSTNTISSQSNSNKDATTNSILDPTANSQNANSNSSQLTSAQSSGNGAAAVASTMAASPQINDKDDVKSALNVDILGNSNGVNKTKDCIGCGVPCNQLNPSPHGALCQSCYHHYSRTGTLRPTSGPGLTKRSRNNGVERHKSKLPRGMYINHDDIVALATQANDPKNRSDELLTSMDREISSLMTQIQNNKQTLSRMKCHSLNEAIQALHPGDVSINRISTRWSFDETQLAIKAFRLHGKDFQAIAELIGTKTEQHVRQFYTNYRKKYNLESIIKEFEEKQQQDEKMLIDDTQIMCGTNPNSNINSNDIKSDEIKQTLDNKVMEIDLVNDIPNNQEDEDMDEVTIIETTPAPAIQKPILNVEPMDSISITAISSSSNNVSSHQPQEPVPEVTISPAPSSLSLSTGTAQSSLASAVNSTVSTSLIQRVEQAKAAAV